MSRFETIIDTALGFQELDAPTPDSFPITPSELRRELPSEEWEDEPSIEASSTYFMCGRAAGHTGLDVVPSELSTMTPEQFEAYTFGRKYSIAEKTTRKVML